ncbi:cytidylyltransferase domain-containing protein [Alkalimonas amylolytica]|uniref:N-acylneuraminate cytidylyltransferase n=1 Tax=Alkalimonas amylolytica TaxID=152573 RepID=A0A1H4B7W3_ALKAM|nr:acylneuraminate cytidylyltransferase family protein [Alkalimonas amylolytica]SEA44335.1 N-acylneuraminate cytidylyltransferase [Alkalimonas amylolytica]
MSTKIRTEARVLAIVPARSGSLQLPDKNIRPFHGKPLMAWSIEAALTSGVVDSVVVSTDSPDYAAIACQYGAEVPFLRPKDLSGSDAGLMAALQYTVQQLALLGRHFDWVLCLQPTSPLRTASHIKDAVQQFAALEDPNKSMASVYPVDAKYRWLLRTSEEGRLQFLDNGLNQQGVYARQHNGAVYMPNGAIFIMQTNKLVAQYTENTYPFLMDEASSADIDTLDEFIQAESLWLRAQ